MSLPSSRQIEAVTKTRLLARQPAHMREASHARGFSLVELLTVLVIISVLTALSFPAVSGLSSSGNVNNAVNDISLLLDQSRVYAMAHNTYVWIGFSQSSTPQQLTVGVVSGTTGQVTDINSAATYIPISKIHGFNNFSLKSGIAGLSGMNTTSVSDVSTSKVATFQQMVDGAPVNFTSGIQYDPQGEASINTTASQWIQIGLQPVCGANANNPNVAVFQVATLTGQVQVFRR